MESRTDIGKAFRDKLDQLQKQPGDSVWDSIKEDLDKGKVRGFPTWVRFSVAAAVFLIVGFLTYPAWENHVPHVYIEMPGENNNTESQGTIVTNESNSKQSEPQKTFSTTEGTANDDNINNNGFINDESSKIAADEMAGSLNHIKTTTNTPKNKVTINAESISGGFQNSGDNVKAGTVLDSFEKQPVKNPDTDNIINNTSAKPPTKIVGTSGEKNEGKNNDANLPASIKTSVDTQTDPVYRNYRNNTSSSVPKDSTKIKEDGAVKKDSLTAAPDRELKNRYPIVNDNMGKKFSLHASVASAEYRLPEDYV